MKKDQRLNLLATIFVIFVCLTCLGVNQAWSQPNLIGYQGILSGPGVSPNGTVDMIFRVYDAGTGGVVQWAEEQLNVQLNQGVYNVLLGDGNNIIGVLDVNLFDGDRWLEVEVNGQIFTPRIRIASVAYSLKTEDANTLGGNSATDLMDYTDTGITNHEATHHTGTSDIPSGVIVIWSGTIANIPSGWSLCDGSNGTPDLRDRFVVGAGVSYSPGNTGGEEKHVLSNGEMPNHQHTTVDPNSPHGGHYIDYGGSGAFKGWTGGGNGHGLVPYVTGMSGGSQAHENRPPYYALAFIMKL
jgi:microcystin-dependent protein